MIYGSKCTIKIHIVNSTAHNDEAVTNQYEVICFLASLIVWQTAIKLYFAEEEVNLSWNLEF
jgi:hypothetical protein